MGSVGLFVLGLVFGVVVMFIGVVVVTATDHQWIPLISSAICGLIVAGVCILVSRHSLKVQVEEFNTAKTVYEEALANDDLSGLERIEIVEKIVEENKWLAKTKYNVKQWYCWFLPDEIVDGVEEIEVSKK
jgi:hypothetical protein